MSMSRSVLVMLLAVVAQPIQAQGLAPATVRITVVQDSTPLEDAIIRAGRLSARTNALGTATMSLTAGRHTLVASRLGLTPDSVVLTLRAGQDTAVTLTLAESAAMVEQVVVS